MRSQRPDWADHRHELVEPPKEGPPHTMTLWVQSAGKVGEATAADLIKQIVKHRQSDTTGTCIVLTVKGVKFRSAKQLKAAMADMRGVDSITGAPQARRCGV